MWTTSCDENGIRVQFKTLFFNLSIFVWCKYSLTIIPICHQRYCNIETSFKTWHHIVITYAFCWCNLLLLYWERLSNKTVRESTEVLWAMGVHGLWLRLCVWGTKREKAWINEFIPDLFLLVNTVNLTQSTPISFYPQYLLALSHLLLRFCGTTFVETAVYCICILFLSLPKVVLRRKSHLPYHSHFKTWTSSLCEKRNAVCYIQISLFAVMTTYTQPNIDQYLRQFVSEMFDS